MASEDMGLVQSQQRLDNGLSHPHHLFHERPPAHHRALAAVAETKATTRELTGGFIDHHQQQQQQQRYFHQPPATDFRRGMLSSAGDRNHQDSSSHNWNPRSFAATLRGDASGEEEEEEEEEDDDDDDEDDDTADENDDSVTMKYQKTKHLSSFEGSKESGNANEDIGVRNAVTVASADGELYYSQYVQGTAETGPRDVVVGGNGCGFSGRKEGLCLSESKDSLRTILTDPLTGALMDDAMILPCGHSFGSGGIQQILRTKLCHTCFKALSEDSISPNLSLRAAVHAFRREEEMQVLRSSKRRKERYEQDGTYGDSGQTEYPRGKGVHFPFAVTDKVIIKGNKRTPPRFVGREAIVTTQCLNGWYVVKTLDNAESVKLQYRSLAKVTKSDASPKPTSGNLTTPNWLQSQHPT